MELNRLSTFDRHLDEVLLAGILPAWGVAGLLDWWFHRRTGIEDPENGGLKESLLHSLMLSEAAIPIGLVVFCEMNPLALSLSAAAAVVHEFTAHSDLNIAMGSRRDVAATEQQVHSFLETLPFALVAYSVVRAWPSFSDWRRRSSWSLRRRADPLPMTALAAGATWMLFSGVLPYAEEAIRK